MSADSDRLNTKLLQAIAEINVDDELRRVRTAALTLSTQCAGDRGQASGSHPGADAILKTAGEFFDFIWNGSKP